MYLSITLIFLLIFTFLPCFDCRLRHQAHKELYAYKQVRYDTQEVVVFSLSSYL